MQGQVLFINKVVELEWKCVMFVALKDVFVFETGRKTNSLIRGT